MQYGGAWPLWASVLVMAEKWNTPPWEIVPEKSQLWWMARWQFFETQRTNADKNKVAA